LIWRKSATFITWRLLQAVPTVLVIVALNFLLLQLAPGDAADVLAGEAGSATPEFMAQLRQKFGLDQPVAMQLLIYIKQVMTLDLGYSFRHGMPVADLILSRLGPSMLLMLTVFFVSVVFGAFLGSVAARNLNRWQDRMISILTVLAYATPVFWAGLMLIVLFSINLGWFPTSGMQKVAAFYEGSAKVVDIAHHLGFAGLDPDPVLSGAVHAPDACFRPRAVLDGLCGHSPCQGLDRATNCPPACAAQRLAAGGDHGGRTGRRITWRRSGGGDGVRLARPWLAGI